MRTSGSLSWLCGAAIVGVSGVAAQSYTTIPTIEVHGQHFFYTNNGSQLHVFLYQELRGSILTCFQLSPRRRIPAELSA
jgi:hypothetical protein